MSDPLLDGFAILKRMPMEEIERRIEWLESTLEVYKVLKITKSITDGDSPPGFHVPWQSAVDMDAQDKRETAAADAAALAAKKPTQEELIFQIKALLLEKGPTGASDIARSVGIEYTRVHNCLAKQRGIHFVRDGRRWQLLPR